MLLFHQAGTDHRAGFSISDFARPSDLSKSITYGKHGPSSDEDILCSCLESSPTLTFVSREWYPLTWIDIGLTLNDKISFTPPPLDYKYSLNEAGAALYFNHESKDGESQFLFFHLVPFLIFTQSSSRTIWTVPANFLTIISPIWWSPHRPPMTMPRQRSTVTSWCVLPI